MSNKTINLPIYTIKQFKEIAYQTSYVLINGWKRIYLSYDDFCNERPDLFKKSSVFDIDEIEDNFWIKDNYKVRFHLPEDKWHERPLKSSIYHTLEEAYCASLEDKK